ncbi:hypothetical protein PGB90_006220 [Kerria lacca]
MSVGGWEAKRRSRPKKLCFIYPVIVHWTWSYQGWLKQLGFIDYAGGMLIHGVAGTACLVAAKLIGPRIGRFDKNSEDSFSGHSNALIGIGSIIILVGFCGFNAGTLNHYSKPRDGIIATIIIRNTIMCGAGGALTTLFLSKFGAFNEKYWYFEFTVNGGLAGLVREYPMVKVTPERLGKLPRTIYKFYKRQTVCLLLSFCKRKYRLSSQFIYSALIALEGILFTLIVSYPQLYLHLIHQVSTNGHVSFTAFVNLTVVARKPTHPTTKIDSRLGLDVASHNRKMCPDYLLKSEFGHYWKLKKKDMQAGGSQKRYKMVSRFWSLKEMDFMRRRAKAVGADIPALKIPTTLIETSVQNVNFVILSPTQGIGFMVNEIFVRLGHMLAAECIIFQLYRFILAQPELQLFYSCNRLRLRINSRDNTSNDHRKWDHELKHIQDTLNSTQKRHLFSPNEILGIDKISRDPTGNLPVRCPDAVELMKERVNDMQEDMSSYIIKKERKPSSSRVVYRVKMPKRKISIPEKISVIKELENG